MCKRLLAMLCGLVVLGGCLPVELDVTPDGRVLIPRAEGYFAYNLKTGQAERIYTTTAKPVFAVAVPKKGGFVAASLPGEAGMMGAAFSIEYVDASGKASPISSLSNVTYMQVSPDGERLSMTRVADQQSEGFDQNMPELLVQPVGGGASKKLAANVGITHRWMPDGKSIVALKLDAKDAEHDRYVGRIVRIDAASGQATPLASPVGPQGVFLELAPDRKTVLFTAQAAGKADASVSPPDDDASGLKLYALDVQAGDVKEAWPNAAYAMYNSEGTSVLVGQPGDNGDMVELVVTDPSFREHTVVADDAPKQAGGFGTSTDIYPGWYDEDTVLYIAQRAVFGTAGTNYMLTSVEADGSNRKVHQPAVDGAALR